MTRLVKLGDHAPLVIKKADIPGPVIAVCRCGLSQAWPLCDGSHAKTRDEDDAKLYLYLRDENGKLSREELADSPAGKPQVSKRDPSYG